MNKIQTWIAKGIWSLFGQYRGMRREIYVLFWGRVATNMGAMIWPMLTLILSNKIGLSPSEIASVTIFMGVLQFPVNLLGGKLADRCNKKWLIIICDLVTVSCYLTAAALSVSWEQILLFYLAGLFQTVENPSYDALIADLSTAENREKAYSLLYLGLNLGLILAPSVGGILFENHLNLAFVIDGLTTLSSTILIFFFVKDITPDNRGKSNIYEAPRESHSTMGVLFQKKVILLFFGCWAVYSFVYAQFNFLIPLNLESLYSARGAMYFGFLTSLNGFVVIIGTPLLTRICRKISDIQKLFLGELLVGLSLSMYIFIQGMLPLYYVSMVLFTMGEILSTLGCYPYITRRIPSTHRGRISSVLNIFQGGAGYFSQWYVGGLLETSTMRNVWIVIAWIAVAGLLCYLVLMNRDKRSFPLFYQTENIE